MPLLSKYISIRKPLTGIETMILGLLYLVALGAVFLLLLRDSWLGLAAIACLLSIAVLMAVPRSWLPGLALATFALVPITYSPMVNPVIGRFMSPALLVVVVWLLRTIFAMRAARTPTLWLSIGGLLVCWVSVTTAWSLDTQRSLLWTTTFCLVAVVPVLLGTKNDSATASSLSKTWLWLGLILGAMAIVEGVTQQSFLAAVYQGTDTSRIGITQNWSSIRSTTTLGHPLMNATFFAAAASYALMNASLTKSKLALFSGLVASAGLIFTLSRSGVVALAVGLALGTVAVFASRKMAFSRKLTFISIATAVAIAVIASPLVQARSDSSEGSNSARLREVLFKAGLNIAAQDNYLGSGAGTSNIRSSLAGIRLPLENSYVGVLVSTGAVGLFLLIALFAIAILKAVKHGRFDAAAGMTAFCVQIGAYPLVDNVPIAVLMFGTLAYLGFSKLSDPQHLSPLIPTTSGAADTRPTIKSRKIRSSLHRRT